MADKKKHIPQNPDQKYPIPDVSADDAWTNMNNLLNSTPTPVNELKSNGLNPLRWFISILGTLSVTAFLIWHLSTPVKNKVSSTTNQRDVSSNTDYSSKEISTEPNKNQVIIENEGHIDPVSNHESKTPLDKITPEIDDIKLPKGKEDSKYDAIEKTTFEKKAGVNNSGNISKRLNKSNKASAIALESDKKDYSSTKSGPKEKRTIKAKSVSTINPSVKSNATLGIELPFDKNGIGNYSNRLHNNQSKVNTIGHNPNSNLFSTNDPRANAAIDSPTNLHLNESAPPYNSISRTSEKRRIEDNFNTSLTSSDFNPNMTQQSISRIYIPAHLLSPPIILTHSFSNHLLSHPVTFKADTIVSNSTNVSNKNILNRFHMGVYWSHPIPFINAPNWLTPANDKRSAWPYFAPGIWLGYDISQYGRVMLTGKLEGVQYFNLPVSEHTTTWNDTLSRYDVKSIHKFTGPQFGVKVYRTFGKHFFAGAGWELTLFKNALAKNQSIYTPEIWPTTDSLYSMDRNSAGWKGFANYTINQYLEGGYVYKNLLVGITFDLPESFISKSTSSKPLSGGIMIRYQLK